MPGDVTSAENVALLRAVAGEEPSHSCLLKALIRAGGDLNKAAEYVLDNGVKNASKGTSTSRKSGVSVLAAKKPDAERNIHGSVPTSHSKGSTKSDATQSETTAQPSVQSDRKQAWRRFYKEKYASCCEGIDRDDKHAVNERIAALWKALGSDGRKSYIASVTGRSAKTIENNVETNASVIDAKSVDGKKRNRELDDDDDFEDAPVRKK